MEAKTTNKQTNVLCPSDSYHWSLGIKGLLNFFFLDPSRSSSRDRKRGRWEEEKERRSESSSGPSRARSHSSIRSRDNEEAFGDRERQRDREKGDEERDEEEFLKPAWIRCTHAENYFSNDPMDQVVVPFPSLTNRTFCVLSDLIGCVFVK